MTDPGVPPSDVLPTELPTGTPLPFVRNTTGIVAMVVAIGALVLAALPATAEVAWVLALPAIITGVAAARLPGRRRRTAIAGIGIGAAAWVLAIVVAAATGGARQADDDPAPRIPTPNYTVPAPAAPSPTPTPTIAEPITGTLGERVVNDAYVAFTLTGLKCGIRSIGESIFTEYPVGQYCRVKFTVKNQSLDPVTVFATDVTGLIGAATYESGSLNDKVGPRGTSVKLNPGLAAKGTIYIDIPKGASLDTIRYLSDYGTETRPVMITP